MSSPATGTRHVTLHGHGRKRKSCEHQSGHSSSSSRSRSHSHSRAKVCTVCETLLPVDSSRHQQTEDHILELLRSAFTRGGSQSFYNYALQRHWDSFFMVMPADFPIPYCRLCCMHFSGFVPFAHHLCERASLVVDTKTDRLHAELLGHFIVFMAGVDDPTVELRVQSERAKEFFCRRCQTAVDKLQLKTASALAAVKAAAAAAASAAAAAAVAAAAAASSTSANDEAAARNTAVSSSSDVTIKTEPMATPSVLQPPPTPPPLPPPPPPPSQHHPPEQKLKVVPYKHLAVKQAKQRLLFRNRSRLMLCSICNIGVDNLAAHLLSVFRCLQAPKEQRLRMASTSASERSALAEYRRSHVAQLIGDCVSLRIERYSISRTVLICPACQLHFHSPSSFYSYFFNHLARNYREDQPQQPHTVLMHRIISLLVDYVADRVSADDVEQFFVGGNSDGGQFYCDAGGLELRHVRTGKGVCSGQDKITDFLISWTESSDQGLAAAAEVWRRRLTAVESSETVAADSQTAADATIIVSNNADVVCQYCGAGFSGRHHLSALHNHLLRALFLGSCEEEAGDLPGAAEASQRRHRLCWSAFAPAGRPARCTACGRICSSLELLAEHIGDRIISFGSALHHAVAEDIAEMLLDVATGRAAHERACSYMENFLLVKSGSNDGDCEIEEFPASAVSTRTKTE